MQKMATLVQSQNKTFPRSVSTHSNNAVNEDGTNSLRKKASCNMVNISAMLSILKKTLHIFNNVQELMRGVVKFEHIGFGQRV